MAGGVSEEKDGSAYTDIAVRAFSMQNSNLKVNFITAKPRKQSCQLLTVYQFTQKILGTMMRFTTLVAILFELLHGIIHNIIAGLALINCLI